MSFREPVEPAVEPVGVGKDTTTGGETKVVPPFKDYVSQYNHPYTVDYFGLGDTWEQKEGGFGKEVSIIESFIESEIDKGEIPNNIEAVKDVLKKLEKMTGIDKNERPLMKIETLAAYVEFLMKCDKIKFNIKRYGSN